MSCGKEFLIDWNGVRSLREFLLQLPVPLVLLDEMGQICWNNQAWMTSVTMEEPSRTPADSVPVGSTPLCLDEGALATAARNFLAEQRSHAEINMAVGREDAGRTADLHLFRTTNPAAALIAIAHRAESAPLSAIATIESVLPWLWVDQEGRITACSASLQARLKAPPDGLTGMPAWTIVHPDDRESYRQKLLHPSLTAGSQAACQMRIMTGDGSLMICEAHMLPVTDASGQLSGLRIALFDVTERERAQEELAESRDLYRTLAENCGIGVWHVSHQGHTIYANPVMCGLLEIDSPDELASSTVNDFFPPASQERIQAEEQQRKAGEVSHYEVELIGKRGTRRHVQVTGATLPDGDYRFSGFLATFIDITASQKRETELRQTQKMEAVGRLAAGIAHEINTPIQFSGDSIQFLRDALHDVDGLLSRYKDALAADPANLTQLREQLQVLEQEIDLEYLQDQMPKAIDRALEGLNRVAAIVRAMKAFANPDDGRKGHANLNQALLTTLTIARNEYKYVADVETDFADLPPVDCSLSELNQVFLNLLVNAAHAIREKAQQQPNYRGMIRVVTRVDGNHVSVTISDTGTGIPVAIQHKIFDPFFTTKPVGSGTGQGLTVAHSVIQRLGGTITVTSESGEGACFTIRLPLHGSSQLAAEVSRP